MYPLFNITSHVGDAYQKYLANKTNFILKNQEPTTLKYFWGYLRTRIYVERSLQNLSEAEKKLLYKLLDNFCYISIDKVTSEDLKLEQKCLWIFKHPDGGIFIPLECLKYLYQNTSLVQRSYFITLLCNLPLQDKLDIVASWGHTFIQPTCIQKERSNIDKAIIIYIFLVNYYSNNTITTLLTPLMQNKILHTPYSSFRQKDISLREFPKEIFPHERVPLKEHVLRFFPSVEPQCNKLNFLMKKGDKSFYRALSIVDKKGIWNDLLPLFYYGLWIVDHDKSTVKQNQLDFLYLSTPREIHNLLANYSS